MSSRPVEANALQNARRSGMDFGWRAFLPVLPWTNGVWECRWRASCTGWGCGWRERSG
jgi:hypothetical protein